MIWVMIMDSVTMDGAWYGRQPVGESSGTSKSECFCQGGEEHTCHHLPDKNIHSYWCHCSLLPAYTCYRCTTHSYIPATVYTYFYVHLSLFAHSIVMDICCTVHVTWLYMLVVVRIYHSYDACCYVHSIQSIPYVVCT